MPRTRIKLTQTTVIYFIVTAVSYNSGAGLTTITLYGGTNYTLANAAITDPFYSMFRDPAGFPMDPAGNCVAQYQRTTNQSIPASTVTAVLPGTKVKDTHGAFNTATGEFTCPYAGDYRVTIVYRFVAQAWTAGHELSSGVLINGNEFSKPFGTVFPTTFTAMYLMSGVAYIPNCAAGDKLKSAIFSSAACTIDGATFPQFNRLTFEYVPNI